MINKAAVAESNFSGTQPLEQLPSVETVEGEGKVGIKKRVER